MAQAWDYSYTAQDKKQWLTELFLKSFNVLLLTTLIHIYIYIISYTSSAVGHHSELTADVDHLLQERRTLSHHKPLIWKENKHVLNNMFLTWVMFLSKIERNTMMQIIPDSCPNTWRMLSMTWICNQSQWQIKWPWTYITHYHVKLCRSAFSTVFYQTCKNSKTRHSQTACDSRACTLPCIAV